jgi:hypothetical protein
MVLDLEIPRCFAPCGILGPRCSNPETSFNPRSCSPKMVLPYKVLTNLRDGNDRDDLAGSARRAGSSIRLWAQVASKLIISPTHTNYKNYPLFFFVEIEKKLISTTRMQFKMVHKRKAQIDTRYIVLKRNI